MAQDSSKERGLDGRAEIGHNSNQGKFPLATLHEVNLEDIAIWPPAEEQATDFTRQSLDEEMEIIASSGQRAILPARLIDGDRIEIVAKAHVVLAIRELAERDGEPGTVQVRIFPDLSDEDAYRLLAQDLEPGQPASSLARGQFFARAVRHFGGVVEAATACRVSKAAVSKNLDVVGCLEFVREKILIHRDIAQRDASWLMRIAGRDHHERQSVDQERRDALLEAIATLPIASARETFASLKKAVAEPSGKPSKSQILVTRSLRQIGSIEPAKGQSLRIDLDDISDVTASEIADAIAEAISRRRSEANY